MYRCHRADRAEPQRGCSEEKKGEQGDVAQLCDAVSQLNLITRPSMEAVFQEIRNPRTPYATILYRKENLGWSPVTTPESLPGSDGAMPEFAYDYDAWRREYIRELEEECAVGRIAAWWRKAHAERKAAAAGTTSTKQAKKTGMIDQQNNNRGKTKVTALIAP